MLSSKHVCYHEKLNDWELSKLILSFTYAIPSLKHREVLSVDKLETETQSSK